MNDIVELTSSKARVVINLKRGNIIASLQMYGKEWMYLDKNNYESEERPRCGCPVLFPYMGIPKDQKLLLKNQVFDAGIHGVVHTNHWSVIEQSQSKASFHTESDETSLRTFPFSFALDAMISVEDNSLFYQMIIRNTSKETMPCDIGFHPFFKTENLMDFSLIVDDKPLPWTDLLYDTVVSQGTLLRNVKKIVAKSKTERLTVRLTENLHNIFLWSGNPSHFLVIEPWTTQVNAINEGKQLFSIEPNGQRLVKWNIQIEEQ